MITILIAILTLPAGLFTGFWLGLQSKNKEPAFLCDKTGYKATGVRLLFDEEKA